LPKKRAYANIFKSFFENLSLYCAFFNHFIAENRAFPDILFAKSTFGQQNGIDTRKQIANCDEK